MAQIGQSDLIEKNNLPVQQIARALVEEKPLSEADAALIRNCLGDRDVALWYDPAYADTMKAMVRTGDQAYLSAHKGAYLSLYLRLGARYPDAYLGAWADLMRAYYDPGADYPVAVIEGVYENDLGITAAPKLTGAWIVKSRELLLKLADFVPLYGLTCSAGAYFWLMGIVFVATWRKKEARRYLTVLAPSAAVALTLLVASPISTEFRYVYGIALCAPVWALIPVITPTPFPNPSAASPKAA